MDQLEIFRLERQMSAHDSARMRQHQKPPLERLVFVPANLFQNQIVRDLMAQTLFRRVGLAQSR
jgi:hypothetical protein